MISYKLKFPIRSLIIRGTQVPEAKGLEVTFDSAGYVELKMVEDPSKGFTLSPEASTILSKLILSEQDKSNYFLACPSGETVDTADLKSADE